MSDIDQTIIRKRGEVVEFKESKKIKEGSVADSLFIEENIYDALCEDIKNSLLDCGYTEVETVSFDEAKYTELLSEKKKDYIGYSNAKKEMREILNAKANVDRLLGSNTTTKEISQRKRNVLSE